MASTELWLGGMNEPDPETGSDPRTVGNPILMGKCVPLALLNVQTQPRAGTGLLAYAVLFGMPSLAGGCITSPETQDMPAPEFIIAIGIRMGAMRGKGI